MRMIDGKTVVLLDDRVTLKQLALFGEMIGCTFKAHESGAIEMVSKQRAEQTSKQEFRPQGG